jgi:glycosyltransferase involved in cell wall biosynthesis
MHEKPFVSVIIPAYNEERFIDKCLAAIKRQTYSKESYEIVVVDNGSSDETVQIARKYSSKVIILPKKNVAQMRNLGANHAAGSLLLFIDADCVPSPNWIFAAVASAEKERCITGSACLVPASANWKERAWFSQKKEGRVQVRYINSGNLIVPRDLFLSLGGFNESLLSGEDYEFCLRASQYVRIISDSSIVVEHLGNPNNLMGFTKREIWHGLGALGTLKYNLFDKPLIGTLLFLIIVVMLFVGLIYFDYTHSILWTACTGLFILLSMSVYYRRQYLQGWSHAVQLFALYFFYYLGRSIALYYISIGRQYRRHR